MNEISFIQRPPELILVMSAIPLYFISCYLHTIIYITRISLF